MRAASVARSRGVSQSMNETLTASRTVSEVAIVLWVHIHRRGSAVECVDTAGGGQRRDAHVRGATTGRRLTRRPTCERFPTIPPAAVRRRSACAAAAKSAHSLQIGSRPDFCGCPLSPLLKFFTFINLNSSITDCLHPGDEKSDSG